MIPPLTRLRLMGLCCPCLMTNETDYVAREACVVLSGVSIKWYRKVVREEGENDNNGESQGDDGAKRHATANAGDAARRILCEGINQIATSLSGESLHLTSTKDVDIEATLDVVDTAHGPAVRITPRCSPDTMYSFADEDDESNVRGRRRPACKTVLLRDIATSAAGDGMLDSAGAMAGAGISCGVKIYGKRHLNSKNMPTVGPAPVPLQFDVLETVVHKVSREEVVQHLNFLANWNKQRIAANVCFTLDTMDEAHYVVIEEADTCSEGGKKKKGIDQLT